MLLEAAHRDWECVIRRYRNSVATDIPSPRRFSELAALPAIG